MIPPALWLIALPIGGAPIVYLLRRFGVGAIIAALITLLSAWLAVQLPTGVVLNLLGRPIALDPLSQATLFFLFAATALLFLTLTVLSVVRDQRVAYFGKVTGQEGRVFYPAALVILAIFVTASLSRHLGITAILIEIAAILMVFVIQTQRLESTRAALRFLVLISLATPAFLLAAWRIDTYQLSGAIPSVPEIDQTAFLVGLGFALWLAIVPFHGWMTSTATESSPITAAFVLITFPIVAFSTFINLLVELPWFQDSTYFIEAVVLAGIVTACIGGVLASVQRGFGELMGYAALYSIGCILAALGLGGRAAVITILVGLAIRGLALVLVAVSMSAIYLEVVSDGFGYVRGLARRLPFATFGLLVGGLTLAGAPLTAGFAPYWQVLRSLSEVDERWAGLLIIGGLGVAIGYLRGIRAMLTEKGQGNSRSRQQLATDRRSSQEPVLLIALIVMLTAACLLLGIFPSWVIEPLQNVAARVTFLIR